MNFVRAIIYIKKILLSHLKVRNSFILIIFSYSIGFRALPAFKKSFISTL